AGAAPPNASPRTAVAARTGCQIDRYIPALLAVGSWAVGSWLFRSASSVGGHRPPCRRPIRSATIWRGGGRGAVANDGQMDWSPWRDEKVGCMQSVDADHASGLLIPSRNVQKPSEQTKTRAAMLGGWS